MKVLVTGGNGFIGKNIKESFLKDKHEIVAPSRQELDCADDESINNYFSKNNFDVVIHAAAKAGHRNSADTNNLFLTNSRMLFNLLKYKNSWGKLINMGSGAIYDMQNYIPKMTEAYAGTHIPKDEHGYNKYIFMNVMSQHQNVYDFRIFGIFGKYEDYAIRFISNAICKSIFELPITLRQNRLFDYLYIDDLMPIIDFYIQNNPKEKSINITPDKSIGLLQIAEVVNSYSEKKLPIQVAQAGMGMEYSGDNTLLKSIIPNVSFTPIEQSIEMLYNWYLQNKTQINYQSLLVDK